MAMEEITMEMYSKLSNSNINGGMYATMVLNELNSQKTIELPTAKGLETIVYEAGIFGFGKKKKENKRTSYTPSRRNDDSTGSTIYIPVIDSGDNDRGSSKGSSDSWFDSGYSGGSDYGGGGFGGGCDGGGGC